MHKHVCKRGTITSEPVTQNPTLGALSYSRHKAAPSGHKYLVLVVPDRQWTVPCPVPTLFREQRHLHPSERSWAWSSSNEVRPGTLLSPDSGKQSTNRKKKSMAQDFTVILRVHYQDMHKFWICHSKIKIPHQVCRTLMSRTTKMCV